MLVSGIGGVDNGEKKTRLGGVGEAANIGVGTIFKLRGQGRDHELDPKTTYPQFQVSSRNLAI